MFSDTKNLNHFILSKYIAVNTVPQFYRCRSVL